MLPFTFIPEEPTGPKNFLTLVDNKIFSDILKFYCIRGRTRYRKCRSVSGPADRTRAKGRPLGGRDVKILYRTFSQKMLVKERHYTVKGCLEHLIKMLKAKCVEYRVNILNKHEYKHDLLATC